jgi:hypothetical protein
MPLWRRIYYFPVYVLCACFSAMISHRK